jgi:hypothetical protein
LQLSEHRGDVTHAAASIQEHLWKSCLYRGMESYPDLLLEIFLFDLQSNF